MRRKKNKIWIYLVALLIVAGVIFISIKTFSNNYEIINADKISKTSERKVVAFGDSLVFGKGSTEKHDFISLLSVKIGQPITNFGINNDTTATALARIDSVTKTKPDIVIVLLGGNDYLKQVPIDTTFSNLEKIVKSFQDNGAAVIILGVRGGLLRDNYNARFEAFAKSHGAAFVPNVLDGLIGDQTLMSDAIHPNDAGYQIIADKVFPTLAKLLK